MMPVSMTVDAAEMRNGCADGLACAKLMIALPNSSRTPGRPGNRLWRLESAGLLAFSFDNLPPIP